MQKLRKLSAAREEGRRKMRLGRRRERNEVVQRGGRGKSGSEGESREELRVVRRGEGEADKEGK